MDVNNKVAKKVLAEICSNYVDVIIDGLEEKQRLPHTMSLLNFMNTLDRYNISYGLNEALTDTFLNRVDTEITNI